MEKNNKYKVMIIILIATVILLAGALVTVCIMNNRPEEVPAPDSAGVGGEIVDNWDPNIDNEQELYRSPLFKPGQGVTSIPLNETLEKGKYDAYVLYQIADLNNPNTKLNSVRSALELIVK